MSERSGSDVGPFLLGVAIGAALGYLFAPAPGAETRRKLTGKLKDLKALAGDQVDDLRALVADDEDEDDEATAEPEPSAREELERRLAAARRRRRDRTGAGGLPAAAEDDEPVA